MLGYKWLRASPSNRNQAKSLVRVFEKHFLVFGAGSGIIRKCAGKGGAGRRPTYIHFFFIIEPHGTALLFLYLYRTPIP